MPIPNDVIKDKVEFKIMTSEEYYQMMQEMLRLYEENNTIKNDETKV